MSRVRNANDFRLRIEEARRQYDQTYGPVIARLRAQLEDPARQVGPLPDAVECLEMHTRLYLLDALLDALNWRVHGGVGGQLPNLFPELPVRSLLTERRRFLDYFGIEMATERPLLIVEAKRKRVELPRLKSPELPVGAPSAVAGGRVNDLPSSVISKGLRGALLTGEWNEVLDTLGDYFGSTQQWAGSVKRVAITNGDWLVLFLDPEGAFQGSADSARILVWQTWSELEDDYALLFQHLEYQRVTDKLPPLRPAEVSFYVDGGEVKRAFHACRVLCFEEPSFGPPQPMIKVMPMLLLQSGAGASVRVEPSRSDAELKLPYVYAELSAHLQNVTEAARVLWEDTERALGRQLTCAELSCLYADHDLLLDQPAVQRLPGRLDAREYLIATGCETHFLRGSPTLIDCPYHGWEPCRAIGVGVDGGPVAARSANPRSFFTDGEGHHCAHREVADMKAAQITSENRSGCGLRSNPDGGAFCELFELDEWLCCRACVFEHVCRAAEAFRLPCAERGQLQT